jgi:hypothetical protein
MTQMRLLLERAYCTSGDNSENRIRKQAEPQEEKERPRDAVVLEMSTDDVIILDRSEGWNKAQPQRVRRMLPLMTTTPMQIARERSEAQGGGQRSKGVRTT